MMKRSAFIGGIVALFGMKASGQQWVRDSAGNNHYLRMETVEPVPAA